MIRKNDIISGVGQMLETPADSYTPTLARGHGMSNQVTQKLPIINGVTKFGRWTLLHEVPPRKHLRRFLCKCDCGTIREVCLVSMSSQNSKSCGCFMREVSSANNSTHGKSGTRTHRIWVGMITRCTNIKEKTYRRYGGRGITVCERWSYPDGFVNFLSDMGECPSDKHSIDRIDNYKGYYPENCRWATNLEQQRNRRNNTMITFNGKSQCLSMWADELQISHSTLIERLQKWPIEKALTQPSRFAKRNAKRKAARVQRDTEEQELLFKDNASQWRSYVTE